MKRTYTTPLVYAESYELMEHVATGCSVNDGFAGARARKASDCAYVNDNMALFYDSSKNCDTSMFDKWGLPHNEQSLVEMNIACYNNFLIVSNLFSS